ncbi:MAG: flotillin-like FloA family protein, partial [Planctomycetota bacterium]
MKLPLAAIDWWWIFAIVGGILLAIIGLVLVVFLLKYGKLWLQAMMSGADVPASNLVRMHFTKVNPNVVVQGKIMARQAGLDINRGTGISTKRLESHYLANGNVMNVIHAIIAAHRANIPLEFDQAAAIDLAGRDVLDAVQTSVYPKVIDCPDPRRSGKTTLSAITKNGIELRVRARVTVRTNLEQLIGGATEDTVIARVGESIISSIGSAGDHFEVLENPDMITRAVLQRGLDAQTAFAIVSIDIADIDVGENIGA